MTENELKQQLSVAYVHAVAALAGYACQLINVDDDSVDVQFAARGRIHETAVVRSPKIDVQLKATAQNVRKAKHVAYPLPIKNYNDLREPTLVPRLLAVLYLPNDEADWLEQSEERMISRHCAYWLSLLNQPAKPNQATVTVHLPRSQQLTVANLRALMSKVARKETL